MALKIGGISLPISGLSQQYLILNRFRYISLLFLIRQSKLYAT